MRREVVLPGFNALCEWASAENRPFLLLDSVSLPELLVVVIE